MGICQKRVSFFTVRKSNEVRYREFKMIYKQIELAKDFIQQADAILITAGAGMGVDSGLPDFRGNSGFWRVYPAIKELGLEFENMANPKWFSTNPLYFKCRWAVSKSWI